MQKALLTGERFSDKHWGHPSGEATEVVTWKKSCGILAQIIIDIWVFPTFFYWYGLIQTKYIIKACEHRLIWMYKQYKPVASFIYTD